MLLVGFEAVWKMEQNCSAAGAVSELSCKLDDHGSKCKHNTLSESKETTDYYSK